jgi:hypothetical protein
VGSVRHWLNGGHFMKQIEVDKWVSGHNITVYQNGDWTFFGGLAVLIFLTAAIVFVVQLWGAFEEYVKQRQYPVCRAEQLRYIASLRERYETLRKDLELLLIGGYREYELALFKELSTKYLKEAPEFSADQLTLKFADLTKEFYEDIVKAENFLGNLDRDAKMRLVDHWNMLLFMMPKVPKQL